MSAPVLTRRQAVTTTAALLACPSYAGAQPRPDRLVFVFSRPHDNYATQWLIRVYTEALGRLGIAFEYLDVPASRATAMSSTGQVDGELGRTYEFADLFPTLVRVEEPNNAVLFSAFALRAAPAIRGWSDLRASAAAIGYRAGIKEIEAALADDAFSGRITSVHSIPSGLMMLQRDRIQLYLDVQEVVEQYLASDAAAQDLLPGPRPRPVAILQRTTGHAYLHQRHRELAPALAAVLRQMKADGAHARYLAEALRGAPIPEGFPGHVPRPATAED